MKVSKRVQQISESLTLALTAKAKQLRQEGVDVIGFGAGEPDFDTPEHIKEVAIADLKNGFTKYTPASGIPELKQAVCDKLRTENGLEYTPKQILISCGAKHSIYNAIMALVDEGDEVIIPSPYWLTYPEQVKAAGGVPVVVETSIDNGFIMTPEQLKSAITDKTVALVLNSPSNPTGAVYSEEQLRALAEVIVDANIMVISDEIYEHLLYDGVKHYSIASFGDEIKALTIVVNGVSKTYSMTGWRIGYAAGPEEIIGAMSRLQSHSTSNPTSFCQHAVITALKGDQSCVQRMLKAFDERRRFMIDTLNSIDGIKCAEPKGAFYVFPDVSSHYGRSFDGKKITNSMEFAEYLLEKARVAVVPGVAFGDDRCVRLSYATSLDNIKEGLERIKKALG
ncbi:pyridoxal phosphate-dependent aminotransferase [Candidatus Sumerlaeota bacterium]|nr:pyridoxal phosphate-dependent aminotransferase [Candidatus Sumerlaeota bacterium]